MRQFRVFALFLLALLIGARGRSPSRAGPRTGAGRRRRSTSWSASVFPRSIAASIVGRIARAGESRGGAAPRDPLELGGVRDRIGAGGARYRRGRVIVKFRDGVSHADAAGGAVGAPRAARRCPPGRRTPTSTSSRSMPSEDAEAVAQALSQRRRRRIRAGGASRAHRSSCRTIRCYKAAAVEPAADRPGARLGHPAAGRIVDRRRGHRHRRRVHERDDDRDAVRVHRSSGVRYPALGRVTIPYAAAPQLGAGLAVCRAARFRLRRHHAARFRRPRHARQRHDRPADQRRRRHGGRRVQRQADAGQGDRQRLGCRCSAVRRTTAAPTTTSRGASATRSTTAPRSST